MALNDGASELTKQPREENNRRGGSQEKRILAEWLSKTSLVLETRSC